MAKILKGSEVVISINNALIEKTARLKENGILPTLAILRVGEIADQVSYANSASKRCADVGVAVQNIILPADSGEETVISSIRDLNIDESVHGILILRPLPKHLNDDKIRDALWPEKDVDGITDSSLAGVFAGYDKGYAPCTAKACIEILKHFEIDCAGKNIAVIGRSLVVGKPVAVMLMKRDATVTVCHTKTNDIPAITQNADIIIAAAGQPGMLTDEYFSPGQVIIDVGTSWSEEEGRFCGDVNMTDAELIVAAITPVPGGVGTVTTAVLASHVVEAAEKTLK